MCGFFGISASVVCRVMGVILCLGYFPLAYADSTVFHSSDVFSTSATCSSCVNDDSLPKLSVTTGEGEHRILMFINPHCPWCKKSLRKLSEFKKKSPGWPIEIYVMGTAEEFKEFVYAQMPTMPSDLDYIWDFNNAMSDDYKVNKTPTYIIINHGQQKKVEGYVDLNHLVSFDNS